MSIHTQLHSSIRDFHTMLTILNENGVPWRQIEAYFKQTLRPPLYVIEAVIAGETVMIYQDRPGDVLVFQSESTTFRNRGAVNAVMKAEPEEVRRQRERAAEQQRQEAERRRQEEERRRQQQAEEQRRRDAERQRLDAERRKEEERRREEQRRLEAEQKRQEEERRRREEERLRREEEERQRRLAEQAHAALSRLDAGFGRPVAPPPTAPVPPPVREAAPTPAATEQLDRMIGKMHQENARRTILEQVEHLQETFGLSLDGQEILDDDTIEITLRG